MFTVQCSYSEWVMDIGVLRQQPGRAPEDLRQKIQALLSEPDVRLSLSGFGSDNFGFGILCISYIGHYKKWRCSICLPI